MFEKGLGSADAPQPRRPESLSPEVMRRQQSLECVLEQSLAGHWDWMIQEGSEYLSPTFKRMFGYEDSELPNKPESWQALVFPEDLPGVFEGFNKHVASRGAFPFYNEVRYRHKNGSTVWVICTGKVIEWDAQGQAVRMVGCHVDITARKQAEAALQQACGELEQRVAERTAELREIEERFSAFMSHLPSGAFINDATGRVLFANKHLQELLNWQNWEGKTAPELVPGEAGQQMLKDDQKALAQGSIRIQETMTVANGEQRTFETIKFPIQVEGKPTLLGGIAFDITERKQAEAALQNLLKEREALLKEVHHRVKNNLQVITSLLRLENRRSKQPDTKAVITDMQGRIYSMARLHESLYRSGNLGAVDLGAYLRDIAAQSFRMHGTQSGLVRLTLDLAAIPVVMDQAAICGLLVNELISNCLKHGFPADSGGEVQVALHPVAGGPQFCLRVSDTGVGLPADFAAKRGQSLGLQLVSDLSDQLKGTLAIGPEPMAVFAVTFTPQAVKGQI